MVDVRLAIEDYLSVYTPEAQVASDVRLAVGRLAADAAFSAELCRVAEGMADISMEAYRESLARMKEHAERLSVHPYTAHLVASMFFAILARERYEAEGLSLALWKHTMQDILYKCTECRLIYGITGTFVADWFLWFFQLRRFALGRLQFECINGRADYDTKTGRVLAADRRINIHIPRTGTPMTPEAVDASLALAADFFRRRESLSKIVFEIHSWLLYPAHMHMLREGSNIAHFAARFDTVDSGEYADYSSAWRLFDKNYEGDPDALPADSSLRRAYIERMKAGLPMGWGYGVFVYGR